MLGFRGAVALRASAPTREAFALECAAMRRVRETMGLTNLKIMIPFCRRLEEAERVLGGDGRATASQRGEDGLEVYVMCEIPNNVILIDEFAELLRRLLDRLERPHPADARRRSRQPRWSPSTSTSAIPACSRSSSRRSRAPSATAATPASAARRPRTIPRSPKYLVELGIDSMSLTPDTRAQDHAAVVELEKKLGRAGGRRARGGGVAFSRAGVTTRGRGSAAAAMAEKASRSLRRSEPDPIARACRTVVWEWTRARLETR